MAKSDTKMDAPDPSGDTTIVLPPRALPECARPRLEFGARTHVGMVRPNNEDQYLIARLSKSLEVLGSSLPPGQGSPLPDREASFLMVADGMGGCAAGERASARVVQEAQKHLLQTAKWFYRLDDPDEGERLRLLREALERVDRQLIAEGEQDPAVAGMGTTLTAASIVGADLFIVHVGDSRAYLFRAGQLEQLTRDHTLVQAMVDRGLLQAEQARTHRLRHVLTNVMGGKPGVEGEIVKLRLTGGDRLLLCTDGLTDPVGDDEIGELLRRHPRPDEACQALVDTALSRGGPDNITLVVAAYLGE